MSSSVDQRLSQRFAQVAAWLRHINLGQYAAHVEENKVDGDTLLELVQVARPHAHMACVWTARSITETGLEQRDGLEALGMTKKLHQSRLRGGLSKLQRGCQSVALLRATRRIESAAAGHPTRPTAGLMPDAVTNAATAPSTPLAPGTRAGPTTVGAVPMSAESPSPSFGPAAAGPRASEAEMIAMIDDDDWL